MGWALCDYALGKENMIDKRIKFKNAPLDEINGKPIFIKDVDYKNVQIELETGLVNWLKKFFRNYEAFYSFLFYVINPAFFLGKPPKSIYEFLPKDALVAEIGSGARRLSPSIINVDICLWVEVDVVADAGALPFADESLDGVICSWILEHLKFPERALSEMRRVLKSGGYIYLSTNFVYPYHDAPGDYYRWSSRGLRAALKDFEEIETRMAVGPTSALLAVFQEWVAIALSFNVKFLKDLIWILVVVLTFPIKFLDLWLIRYTTGESIAGGFYYIGRKR